MDEHHPFLLGPAICGHGYISLSAVTNYLPEICHMPRHAIGKESNREFHKIEGREKDLITTRWAFRAGARYKDLYTIPMNGRR